MRLSLRGAAGGGSCAGIPPSGSGLAHGPSSSVSSGGRGVLGCADAPSLHGVLVSCRFGGLCFWCQIPRSRSRPRSGAALVSGTLAFGSRRPGSAAAGPPPHPRPAGRPPPLPRPPSLSQEGEAPQGSGVEVSLNSLLHRPSSCLGRRGSSPAFGGSLQVPHQHVSPWGELGLPAPPVSGPERLTHPPSAGRRTPPPDRPHRARGAPLLPPQAPILWVTFWPHWATPTSVLSTGNPSPWLVRNLQVPGSWREAPPVYAAGSLWASPPVHPQGTAVPSWGAFPPRGTG